ncbi:MAG: TauD/TfdA family dioxygenase [Actinomycetota bacterium]
MNFATELRFASDDPVLEASALAEALADHAVVRMTPSGDLGDLRAFYDRLIEATGEPITIGEDFTAGGAPTGERWLEIRYDADIPDMAAFRHSKNAQPLHTDESYISDPADVMFFYCVTAAPSGGETIFVSNDVLLQRLREDEPDLLEALLSTDITYAKSTNVRTRPIIRVEGDGQASLNFNYFCVDREQPAARVDLNQAFHDYLESRIVGSGSILEVGLQPGEAVAWWDHLVLHGRNAFVAHETNDRFIWKAGLRIPAAA